MLIRIATMAVAGLGLLAMVTTDSLTIFANQPVMVAELAFPPALRGLLIPMLLTGLSVAMRVTGSRRLEPALGVMAAGVGLLYWVRFLVLHDRWITALQLLLLMTTLLAAVLPERPVGRRGFGIWRIAGLGGFAAVMATLSFGAIWGEERCGESGPVDCLVGKGPREFVPRWFALFGVEIFIRAPGADLAGMNLYDRDLRYVRLPGADLSQSELGNGHFRRADLSGSNLSSARLAGSFAQGANLSRASLLGADVRKVNAFRIDLRNADLRRVIAVGASFSHGYWDGARLNGGDFRGAYLRFSEGLTQAQLDTACGDERTRLSPGLTIPRCGSPGQ